MEIIHRVVAALLAATALVGCAPASSPEDVSTTAAAPTAVDSHAVDAIRAARAALGEPAVALAEALLNASARVEAARYEVERGAPMRAAVEELPTVAADLRGTADTVTARLPDADPGTLISGAVTLVVELGDTARSAADAIEAEAASLEPLIAADEAMGAAVAAWQAPGSQSARRAVLADQAAALDQLAAQLRAVVTVPAACTTLTDNRIHWAALLATRTRELAERATSAGGADYDELRASYAREPYGQDRQVADAAGRACWQESSAVAAAGDHALAEIDRLEILLS